MDIENRVSKEFPAQRIIRSAEIDSILERLSPSEIADLLLDRVWAGMDMLSTESAIVSAAIELLRKQS